MNTNEMEILLLCGGGDVPRTHKMKKTKTRGKRHRSQNHTQDEHVLRFLKASYIGVYVYK